VRARRIRAWRVVFLLALALAGAGYAVWRRETTGPLLPAGSPPAVLNVTPGMSADAIGRELWSMGALRHPLIFRAVVRQRGAAGQLRAGRYRVDSSITLGRLVEMLRKGEGLRNEVTFREGMSYAEMAPLAAQHGVSAEAFLKAARDPALVADLDPAAKDLEGYLFPDTYDIPEGPNSAPQLVAQMVRRFRSVITPEQARLEKTGLTLRQLVTLASLVELETGLPAERPRIAAVFLNRLEKRMLLQTDPTVIYALRKSGSFDGNIRKKDLEVDSPYNTYRHLGLPPGPIASPGLASLRAVLEPAPVKDLYFVSRNDGSHEFNESLAQHERAVDRYQRRGRGSPPAKPSAGPGKTPE
jgi:UPF0755 protein